MLFNLPPGSLGPLSVQLGEVKAICDVLFRAKINSLDNLQRERGLADTEGLVADYLEPTVMSVTNELAVLTPYSIQFHCFSAEIAGVLAGFANNRHGIIVKSINVEPETGTAATVDALTGLGMVPGAMPPGSEARFGGDPRYGGAIFNPAAATPTPAARGAPLVALDEKPLRVTLVVNVVKLLPGK
jgi:hypothetical protein